MLFPNLGRNNAIEQEITGAQESHFVHVDEILMRQTTVSVSCWALLRELSNHIFNLDDSANLVFVIDDSQHGPIV